MSHGCVNLAPLDAKHLFFFSDPPLPKGFHGPGRRPSAPARAYMVTVVKFQPSSRPETRPAHGF